MQYEQMMGSFVLARDDNECDKPLQNNQQTHVNKSLSASEYRSSSQDFWFGFLGWGLFTWTGVKFHSLKAFVFRSPPNPKQNR